MDEVLQDSIKKLRKSLEKSLRLIVKLEDMVTYEDQEIIDAELIRFVEEAEKNAVMARTIPEYRIPEYIPEYNSYFETDEESLKGNKMLFSTVDDGIEKIVMPRLLPHRPNSRTAKHTVKNYFEKIYYPQIREYFKGKTLPENNEKKVMWFVHKYSKKKWANGLRDHSNIEVKMVEDFITPFLLSDDSPKYCDLFQTSVPDVFDETVIYLVPYSKFTDFSEKVLGNYAKTSI